MIPKSCCFKCQDYGIDACDNSHCYTFTSDYAEKCDTYRCNEIQFKEQTEEPEAEGGLTLGKLRDCLIVFCNQHPELMGKSVAIASECGYAGAGIARPFCIAVNQNYNTVPIRILTDDDGYEGNYLFYVEDIK